MTLELNDYGLEFDTYVCYIALSWQVLIPATIAHRCGNPPNFERKLST